MLRAQDIQLFCPSIQRTFTFFFFFLALLLLLGGWGRLRWGPLPVETV